MIMTLYVIVVKKNNNLISRIDIYPNFEELFNISVYKKETNFKT